MNVKRFPKVTLILIILYVSVFLLDIVVFKGVLFEWGGGKSFNNMESNEWYRLLTGTIFHHNMLHLLGNTFAIYFVGLILEHKIGSWSFLFVYLVGNIGTSSIYAIFLTYTNAAGASPGIYALIACIVILHRYNQEFLDLHYRNWPVNYTLYYAILGNFFGMDAFIVHITGFTFGAVIALMFYFLKRPAF